VRGGFTGSGEPVKVPLLIHLSVWCEAAPLVAVVVARRPVRGARAWVVGWSVLLLVENLILYQLAARRIHNLWVPYIFTPATTAALLWALSLWQIRDIARLTMRLSIVPFLVTWAVVALAFDSTSSFSRAAQPLAYVVGLFAAAYTLVALSRAVTSDLLRQDWFWVSAGLVLYLGTFSMIGPLSSLLAGTDVLVMVRAYEFEATLSIVAFLAIARGVSLPAEAVENPAAR
jgi:hypothetical protein